MKDLVFDQLKKEFSHLQKNIPLKQYTTFNIGGPAKYFLVVKKESELLSAIALAKKLKVPVFVLGGGSNLLVSDKGFSGLVIKIELKQIRRLPGNVVESESGATMKELVNFAIKEELAGLEWAGGLPGTFGGAVRGNAGCFGSEIKDVIASVKALDSRLVLRDLSWKQCHFLYRSSVFKKKGWQVISATVKLKPGKKEELRKLANDKIAYRKKTHPMEFPNAGSVFKNVPVKSLSKKFKEHFADKVKQDPFPIVPTAWLIIDAGLTGKKIGKAQISTKHSNYIVNLGGAKAKDVLGLITFAQKVIKKKYGVMLEPEVQYLA